MFSPQCMRDVYIPQVELLDFITLTLKYKRHSKPNRKILEPESGQVLTLSIWYKVKSNLDVHLFEPGQMHFVQVQSATSFYSYSLV